MNSPNNPPAFPQNEFCAYAIDRDGMTLRDWFAGQVNVDAYGPFATFKRTRGHEPTIEQLAEYIAAIRFIEADAMLSARSVRSETDV